MRYTITYLHTVAVMTKNGKSRNAFEHVTEFEIDARDMQSAARVARGRMTIAADAYRVQITVTPNSVAEAASHVAHAVLNKAYSRQALDFVHDALQSIEVQDINPDAGDIIGAAMLAMYEAMTAGMCNYAIYRAGMQAANTYIMKQRHIRATTLAEDMTDYVRYLSGRAADSTDAYWAGLEAECDDNRAVKRAALKAARDAMTAKQWKTLRVLASGHSMSEAASALGLANKSTVCRHVQAARKAIEAAGLAYVGDTLKPRRACTVTQDRVTVKTGVRLNTPERAEQQSGEDWQALMRNAF